MDHFNTLVDNCTFYNFANKFNGEVKIDQFKRINDTTISWTKSPRLCNSRTPSMSIELTFDENHIPVFKLIVEFFDDIFCFEKFQTVTDAIDYVNNAINSARIRKQCRDKIWSHYGF